MAYLKKIEHSQWIDNYKAKGGKTTEYICGHCDNPVEIPLPTNENVSSKGYCDGMKECPDCGGHNCVSTWPNGATEVQPID